MAMREQSTKHQAELKRNAMPMHDLDTQYCIDQLRSKECSILIHGHTHQARDHDLGAGLKRMVLSDWHVQEGQTTRAQVLRLHHDEFERINLY
jgi:UDP-2,3-diacylglucosamine hydrolase